MSLVALASVLLVSSPRPLSLGIEPRGFLATPRSGRGAGVLVLHPWWGLNADVRTFCRRLAEAGFVAFAPDLFGGRTAGTRAQAEALVRAYQAKEAASKARLVEAARFLARHSGREEIAVVGFSFGGYYALELSNADSADDGSVRVRAVVDFYSTGPEDFRRSKAAYLGHFAEHDEFEPRPGVDALRGFLRAAGRPATFYTYLGTGHWFFEPSVKGSYDRAAAELAWRRTLAFLRTTMATRPASPSGKRRSSG